jgi:hypothetical protein
MGFLLKFILLGVAAYMAWKTVDRWKGMFDRLVGRPDRPAAPVPPPPGPTPSHRVATVEDTVQCPGCGSYGLAGADKCSQCGRPLPQGRN